MSAQPPQPLTSPSADRELRDAGRADMRRGLVWLGGASAVARVLDALGVVVVMWFTSREQLGLATLAWSVSVFIEAMNGLGVSSSLLQAREVSEARLASAFWYTMAVATLVVGAVSALSPALADLFGAPALAPLIVVASCKLWLVGTALIPLNLLNRAMRFERIAAISTGATLGSNLLTIVLVVLDYGAWGIVLGQTSHGLFTAILANVVSPYRPRAGFQLALAREDIVFGAKISASSMLYHFYRNADYYLLGRFLGVGAVGVYRVAFDLAMQPTLAILQVVSRSALPVYARLNHSSAALRDAFLWTLRNLGILLAPVTALLWFAAEDLLRWIDRGRWLDAAPMVRWLALAALLRSVAQTFPQVFLALKRPAFALYDSLFTMAVLIGAIGAGLFALGDRYGAQVAAWGWALTAPLEIALLFALIRPLLGLRARELLGAGRHTAGALASMAAAHALFLVLPFDWPRLLAPVAHLALLAAAYAAYLRWGMRVRLAGLLAREGASGDAAPPS